ncbi:hypothetical protein [Hymenobacter koreensis]|uniref:Uncharacterized protein n=1 Tax=Hymenobacter koreensis TaxID=1084523 RepID=A0ABP8JJH1_9BACT
MSSEDKLRRHIRFLHTYHKRDKHLIKCLFKLLDKERQKNNLTGQTPSH